MKIQNISESEIRVHFKTTLPSSRKRSNHIRITFPSKHNDRTFINIPALGDIQECDIDEFVNALSVSKMIASNKLEIDFNL